MTWTTRPRSELDGLAVVMSGKGPRIVLIHGVGLRAEAWNAQIDALSRHHEVLAPDLPGHCASDALPVAPGLRAYSERIARLVDQPAVLVGHSMGAMIALDMAGRYPKQVQGVAALNAIFKRSPVARAAVQERAAALDGISVSDPGAPLSRWFGDTPSPERTACRDWLTAADPHGYKAAYSIFATEDGPDETLLKNLSCPALFMTGGKEQNSTPAMSHAMANLAPNGTAQIVDDAAHMMPMTHPAEVNRALLGFAERCQQ